MSNNDQVVIQLDKNGAPQTIPTYHAPRGGKPDEPENAGKNSCRELGSNLYDFGSPALADVVEERHRQKTKEGFTEAHDDEYNKNEIGRAHV